MSVKGSVKGKLESDLKAALIARDAERTSLARLMLAQIKNREIEKRTKEGVSELSDGEIIEVLRRELKKRREAIGLFKKGGREDLAAKEESESKLIESYLPPEMGRSEIEQVIERVVAGGHRDFNSVMREAMKELKGKADGRLVGEVVKEKTSA